MSDFEPFYDVSRSYEDNYEQGPFGAFAEALKDGNGADAAGTTSEGALATFLGQPVNLPFGIPAGPLLNSRFTTAAFRMGFDLATYKTVRSRAWGCNPFPNVLAVHPKAADGSLTPGSAELDEGVLADTNYETPISISNSFGVPSQSPDAWQPDMRAAIEAAGPGQVLVPSFQGSRVEGMSEEEYIADHATTARLVKETGAKLMVMNTSCPNEGHNRLLCHNPLLVGRITEAVKQEIGDIPLMVKLAYIPSDGDLELMVRSTVGHGTVQGFSTINTISAKLVANLLVKNGFQHLHAARIAGKINASFITQRGALAAQVGVVGGAVRPVWRGIDRAYSDPEHGGEHPPDLLGSGGSSRHSRLVPGQPRRVRGDGPDLRRHFAAGIADSNLCGRAGVVVFLPQAHVATTGSAMA